jgi:P27 family predicted phage terminase small subunit
MAAKKPPVSNRGTFPNPPKHLNTIGKKAWDLGVEIWNDGTLKERDLYNWGLFCEAVQEKEHCEKLIKKDGDYQMCINGCYAQHPAVKRRQHAEDVIRKYSLLFGLLPEARKKRPTTSQGVAQRPR